MSASLSAEELKALNHGVHTLARNLFTYSQEIGVFMAVTDKDKEILKVRKDIEEENSELLDAFSDAVVRTGKQPRVGGYEEHYTHWSYRTETTMLAYYLQETNEHYKKLIRLRNEVSTLESPSETVLKLFDEAITQRREALERLNALTDGICDPVEIEDAASSIDGKIKVAESH